jgi:5,10-methylenetetrahydromethanopterin reductase
MMEHRAGPAMQFGISYPTYIRAWHDVQMAEDYGFSHAWFDDSHMCYSDIFATMALAAEHSRSSVLGTFVACAGNRAAPVSATALATLNELAPGRIIAGIGTGFSARNVMGMPATR